MVLTELRLYRSIYDISVLFVLVTWIAGIRYFVSLMHTYLNMHFYYFIIVFGYHTDLLSWSSSRLACI